MSETNVSAEEAPPAGLTWGVKRSFMGYLGSLPDAEVSVGEGAVLVGDGFFNFALAGSALDPRALTGTLAFRGQVLLSGHMGMMSVGLCDPRLELNGAEAVLSVAAGNGGDGTFLPLAALADCAFERHGADLLWSATKAFLTAEGAEVFGRQYAPGQELDPVFVRIPLS